MTQGHLLRFFQQRTLPESNGRLPIRTVSSGGLNILTAGNQRQDMPSDFKDILLQ
jgi:hypothetical protein